MYPKQVKGKICFFVLVSKYCVLRMEAISLAKDWEQSNTYAIEIPLKPQIVVFFPILLVYELNKQDNTC